MNKDSDYQNYLDAFDTFFHALRATEAERDVLAAMVDGHERRLRNFEGDLRLLLDHCVIFNDEDGALDRQLWEAKERLFKLIEPVTQGYRHSEKGHAR